MTQKLELGKLGEDTACEFLKKKKYKIIERNFRRPWGEIDIVAKAPDKTLVFVEVKTVGGGSAYYGIKPEDQMTDAKIRKIKKAAMLYAGHSQNLIDDRRGWRLDLVAITFKDEENYEISHYENIS